MTAHVLIGVCAAVQEGPLQPELGSHPEGGHLFDRDLRLRGEVLAEETGAPLGHPGLGTRSKRALTTAGVSFSGWTAIQLQAGLLGLT